MENENSGDKKRLGFAVTGMSTGILSLLILPLILGIIAIIFSCLGNFWRKGNRLLGIVGLVTGSFSIIFSF